MRSIPAHAGEPHERPKLVHPAKVYPRPRGGTDLLQGCPAFAGGLSPPTRGNPEARGDGQVRNGSIPAHAGEPGTQRNGGVAERVYPRPRGGTKTFAAGCTSRIGLSPPTRGNLERQPRLLSEIRSIPAHAGEPAPMRNLHPNLQVYPRPRGGTYTKQQIALSMEGLSPPTRGNLYQTADSAVNGRSIPAHAGEPLMNFLDKEGIRVYPRPRGGTPR